MLESMGTLIEILPYRTAWPNEFRELGARLRNALGDAAQRIDHIGSTAVPDLAAKDVIDVQITVASLDEGDVIAPLVAIGAKDSSIVSDHQPPRQQLPAEELRKRLVGFYTPHRRANVHISEAGRFNQRSPRSAATSSGTRATPRALTRRSNSSSPRASAKTSRATTTSRIWRSI